jgi:small subunit ribosomal protein S1
LTQERDDFSATTTITMEAYLDQELSTIKTLAHGDIIDGIVVRVDPDEVLVDVGSKSEGVISNRELGTRGEQDGIELEAGDRIKVFVLQPENEDGNVVLSLRRARAESIWTKAAEKQVNGEVLDAEVREQNKGGLIVNIMGLRGFLPTSQVSRSHNGGLDELVGKRINVKVLEVNRKRNRLIVSQKAAQDEDRARQRSELFERLKVSDQVRGRVSGLTSYGAFVNLGGADGLIHISELSWERVGNVSEVLQVGQEVTVKVIKLDPELSRISLSLRQMSEDPWDSIEQRFPPGSLLDGEVTKVKKYGAFLQVGDGVEGLLHISELSWDHVERTEDVVKVGDRLRVMVLQADKVRRRISLSLKLLQERSATDVVPDDSQQQQQQQEAIHRVALVEPGNA